ncbi:MAG TPA: Ppx/GppA family phosphatase [Firmicutes bacterium]|nr:Ppx/GppA family phosphatase [Bacillota bacterium]
MPYFCGERDVVRLAAIDIGTNSTRLLVAMEVNASLEFIHQDIVTTRLGLGSKDCLLPQAMDRTAAAVTEFYRQAKDLGADVIRVFGTSALREAANQKDFLALVTGEIGQKPEVLSGEQEARLTYLGAIRALRLNDRVVLIDVGGGSTEIIWGQGKKVLSLASLRLGAVHLTEKYLRSDPPAAAEWDEMVNHIELQLHPELLPLREKASAAVAVGGTATTVAAMLLKLVPYDGEKVQGYFVPDSRLHNLIKSVSLLPLDKRRQLPGLQPERADIILAGVAILSSALKIIDLPGFTVSEADLLLGSLYDMQAYRGSA